MNEQYKPEENQNEPADPLDAFLSSEIGAVEAKLSPKDKENFYKIKELLLKGWRSASQSFVGHKFIMRLRDPHDPDPQNTVPFELERPFPVVFDPEGRPTKPIEPTRKRDLPSFE